MWFLIRNLHRYLPHGSNTSCAGTNSADRDAAHACPREPKPRLIDQRNKPLAIGFAAVTAVQVPRSRPPSRRGAGRGCELGQAAGEIAQVLVQLVERKADGEDALHRVVR